jgi:APA family basic amino acid/polyamine antiporter
VTDASSSRAPQASGDLRRQLGLWDAVAIFVGIILGSGVFVAPAAVARAAPGWASAVGLWLVGGLVAACGAFCYAECGARLPRTGGFYVFYREAFGELIAFVGGWSALLVTYPASIAAIAAIFAKYLRAAFPGILTTDGQLVAAAAGAVIAAGALNALGVRTGAWTQRVLTAGKFSALGALCLAAVLAPGRPDPVAVAPPALDLTADLGVLLLAMVLVLWTYDGWSDVTLVSGEIRRPGRNIGRSVLLGIGALIVLYAAVQLAILTVLPAEQAARSEQVLSDAVEVGLGAGAGRLVALLVVVSTLGSINGIVLAASRVGYAMARGGAFFGWFGQVHPRFGTPARSVGMLIAATLIYTVTASFDALMKMFSFSVWIFYGLTAVATVILRHRRVGEPIEWRAPGGWLAPCVVLTVAVAMTTWLAWAEPRASLTGLGLLSAAVPVFFVWKRLGVKSRLDP